MNFNCLLFFPTFLFFLFSIHPSSTAQNCTPLINFSPFHSRIFLIGSLPWLFLDPSAACCYMYHTASFNREASYLLIHWWVYICSESSGPQIPCIWDFPAASNEFTRLWGAALITGPEHGPAKRAACFWPGVEAPTNVPIYKRKSEVWRFECSNMHIFVKVFNTGPKNTLITN